MSPISGTNPREGQDKASTPIELLGRIAALANQFVELESGLTAVLSEICGYSGWPVGHVFVVGEEGFQDARIWHMSDMERLASFQRASIDKALLGPHGLIHRALEKREPVSMSDVSRNPTFLRAREAREAGLRTGLAVPALIGNKVMAVLEFYSLEPDAANSELLEVLTIVGTVVGRMIERVRAEQRQRDQATHYQLLFESTNDASFIYTPAGEITATNAAAQRLVSYVAEDLVGRNVVDLVAPEFQGLARMRLEPNGDGEANPRFEIALVDRAGRRIPVEVTTAFLHVHGRAVAVQSTMRDMSDRLRAEVALKESEERFRRAFESAPIGMALNGPDGTWLLVNEALCRLVGYPSEELMQMTHQDITHPDDVDTDSNNTRRLYDGETTSYDTRKRYLHKNGATIEVLVRRSIVSAADGTPAYSIAQIVDLAAEVDPPSNGRTGTVTSTREQLSRREIEVLALLAKGMTNESAATHLSIGHETVQTYVRRAMKKLGARTRTQAVASAMAQGVLSQHR